ncbi:hypothetical protein [Mesorhizobium sp. Root695]|uniref:hypothetical protein n=1 Tax=Mesorhizobium sp. Root695 TaxID=1736589 RepID=UPI00138F8518|nr:hypothetical protein [Mesorhizobium sp. Root695]
MTTNSAAIQSGAAIAGVLVGIFGFGATICQLSATKNALQASNTYTIQHDARELITAINPNIRKIRAGTVAPEEKDAALVDVWKMLNFYLSVYRQSVSGGIKPDFSQAFADDFCSTISNKGMAAAWDQLKAEDRISDKHEKMKEGWCGTK